MAKINFNKIYGDNTPLFLKMLAIFAFFSLITIMLFWVLGFAMSGTLYAEIRKGEAIKTAKLVAENISNPDLYLLTRRLSREEGHCIMVVDKEGYAVLSEEASPSCSVHLFSASSLSIYYNKAKDAGGVYTEVSESIPSEDSYEDAGFVGDVPKGKERKENTYIYTLIAKNDVGESYAVLVDTAITPTPAHKQTIIVIFVLVTVLTASFSAFLSYRVSKEVSVPIVELTKQAKEISTASADLQITGKGFKEINELRDSLEEAQKEVAEVEHFRRELIANVSHDLRTPLTLIKGYTELMRDIPSEATPENFQVVIDETTRLTTLVNDMLSLSREQEGNEELNLTRFDVIELLKGLITRHSKLIEHMGYTIELQCDEKAFVLGDETKLTQVIYNLINNAVNYSDEDKKVIVKEYVKGGIVRIEVTDNGPGVDVEILPHIWDRYYKSDKNHRRAMVGTGLGLSIVKSVMSKHPGGAYGVITSVGEGSTFYIELQRA